VSAVAKFYRIKAELKRKAYNAAYRRKPLMWAHYRRMLELMEREFRVTTDGDLAGQALAISQRAEIQCPTLPYQEAAELWDLSVIARRILNAYCPGSVPKVSLDWLRQRANTRYYTPRGEQEEMEWPTTEDVSITNDGSRQQGGI